MESKRTTFGKDEKSGMSEKQFRDSKDIHQSDYIAKIENVRSLTARSRVDITLYPSHLHLYGKKFTTRIDALKISNIFLLSHENESDNVVAISIKTPVCVNKTAYSFFIFVLDEKKDRTLKINLPSDPRSGFALNHSELNLKNVATKFALILKQVTRANIWESGRNLRRNKRSGFHFNQNTWDVLYPLDVGFFLVSQKPAFIKNENIKWIEFGSIASAGLGSFELRICTTSDTNSEYIFNNVKADSYKILLDFVKRQNLHYKCSEQYFVESETKVHSSRSKFIASSDGGSEDSHDDKSHLGGSFSVVESSEEESAQSEDELSSSACSDEGSSCSELVVTYKSHNRKRKRDLKLEPKQLKIQSLKNKSDLKRPSHSNTKQRECHSRSYRERTEEIPTFRATIPLSALRKAPKSAGKSSAEKGRKRIELTISSQNSKSKEKIRSRYLRQFQLRLRRCVKNPNPKIISRERSGLHLEDATISANKNIERSRESISKRTASVDIPHNRRSSTESCNSTISQSEVLQQTEPKQSSPFISLDSQKNASPEVVAVQKKRRGSVKSHGPVSYKKKRFSESSDTLGGKKCVSISKESISTANANTKHKSSDKCSASVSCSIRDNTALINDLFGSLKDISEEEFQGNNNLHNPHYKIDQAKPADIRSGFQRLQHFGDDDDNHLAEANDADLEGPQNANKLSKIQYSERASLECRNNHTKDVSDYVERKLTGPVSLYDRSGIYPPQEKCAGHMDIIRHIGFADWYCSPEQDKIFEDTNPFSEPYFDDISVSSGELDEMGINSADNTSKSGSSRGANTASSETPKLEDYIARQEGVRAWTEEHFYNEGNTFETVKKEMSTTNSDTGQNGVAERIPTISNGEYDLIAPLQIPLNLQHEESYNQSAYHLYLPEGYGGIEENHAEVEPVSYYPNVVWNEKDVKFDLIDERVGKTNYENYVPELSSDDVMSAPVDVKYVRIDTMIVMKPERKLPFEDPTISEKPTKIVENNSQRFLTDEQSDTQIISKEFGCFRENLFQKKNGETRSVPANSDTSSRYQAVSSSASKVSTSHQIEQVVKFIPTDNMNHFQAHVHTGTPSWNLSHSSTTLMTKNEATATVGAVTLDEFRSLESVDSLGGRDDGTSLPRNDIRKLNTDSSTDITSSKVSPRIPKPPFLKQNLSGNKISVNDPCDRHISKPIPTVVKGAGKRIERFYHNRFGYVYFPAKYNPFRWRKIAGRDEQGKEVFYPKGPCLSEPHHVCARCRELGHTKKQCSMRGNLENRERDVLSRGVEIGTAGVETTGISRQVQRQPSGISARLGTQPYATQIQPNRYPYFTY